MDTKYNGTSLSSLKFNGADLDYLKFNGTTVWQRATPGVAAKADLILPSMSNLMVWAYFKGRHFYAATGYGLNMSEIKQYFDDAYASQGYTLTYTDTTFHLESPQATGGDHNGEVFTIEYRSRFTGPANYTYSATLHGGQNAS